jgi:hypothetical protein
MPELTTISPYVDSVSTHMGNPMPESTLTLCHSQLCPPVRDLEFLFLLWSPACSTMTACNCSVVSFSAKLAGFSLQHTNTACKKIVIKYSPKVFYLFPANLKTQGSGRFTHFSCRSNSCCKFYKDNSDAHVSIDFCGQICNNSKS